MTLTKFKHIVVSKDIFEELKNLGKAGDSFNDVIKKLLMAWDPKR